MIFLLILLFSNYFLPHKVLAISPTISPTTTPADNQSEIQKFREVVQQKVKDKLREISQPSDTPKGIVGKIIQVDTSQFTIEYQNNSRTVKFDDATVFIDSNRNKSKADKFKIGQDILALGIFDDSNILIAKRIISTDLKSVINDQKVVVIGKIVDVSKSSSIFSLIPIKNKNIQYQIKIDTKTEVTNAANQKITTNDLQSGQKIITILSPDKKLAKTYYAPQIIDLDYQPPTTPTLKPTPTKKP